MTPVTADAASSQLIHVDPAGWAVALGWRPLVDDFFAGRVARVAGSTSNAAGKGGKGGGGHLGGAVGPGPALLTFLARRLAEGAVVFPPQPLRALDLTPPDQVGVVILGQDPYHGRGQAEGLAFSVAPGVALPPSLRNIFKELERDLGTPPPAFPVPGGSLVKWAANGVLLLNTCLTVEEGKPGSHTGKGWETLTDAIIHAVSSGPQPVVFMLWGAHAQSKQTLIDHARHKILLANHPSPLAALRPPLPFIGCGHFSAARAWRDAQGR